MGSPRRTAASAVPTSSVRPLLPCRAGLFPFIHAVDADAVSRQAARARCAAERWTNDDVPLWATRCSLLYDVPYTSGATHFESYCIIKRVRPSPGALTFVCLELSPPRESVQQAFMTPMGGRRLSEVWGQA